MRRSSAGAGPAHDDVLLVQPQVRLAPTGIVGDDEQPHAADPGSERVERVAVVLGLERAGRPDVEGHRRHRRLLDLVRERGVCRHDRRVEDEVPTELRLSLVHLCDRLPVAVQIRVVGRLEGVGAGLSEYRSAARPERPLETCDRSTGASGASSWKQPSS